MATSKIPYEGPVVLYDKEAGATSGSLSKSVSNFKRIRVTFGTSDRGYLLGNESYTHGKDPFYMPLSYITQSAIDGNTYINTIRIQLNGTSWSTDRVYSITVARLASGNNTISEWTGGRIFRIEGFYS